MDKQLFIPERINVGYVQREGTYTGKLAYVIYWDKKGVLRKEKSFNTWRDKKIAPTAFDNVPTEGFVLNKGVGGARQSYGWNPRNEYIRVYDPRNFEFEISVANLMFIMQECNSTKGKGLEGKFVYSWDGSELVLLPEDSADYRNSMQFSTLQGKSFSIKELRPGFTYETKKQESLIYLGKFDHYYPIYVDNWRRNKNKTGNGKFHVFYETTTNKFRFLQDGKQLARCVIEEQASNFAELVDLYVKSPHSCKITRLFLEDSTKKKYGWADSTGDGGFQQFKIEKYRDGGGYVSCNNKYTLNDGVLCMRYMYGSWYFDKDGKSSDYYDRSRGKMPQDTGKQLAAELENGKIYRVFDEQLVER